MSLTNEQINELIGLNVPNNNQLLITPAKMREVLYAMQTFSNVNRTTGDTLQGVVLRGNETDQPIILPELRVISGVNPQRRASLQFEGNADRALTIPDEAGVLATRAWVNTGLDGKQDDLTSVSGLGAGKVLAYTGSSLQWVEGGGSGGGFSMWGSIEGDLEEQEDLWGVLVSISEALAGKAAAVHTHGISDVTGLQTALDGKQAAGSYAAAVHSHLISDVTGLQAALDGKQAAGSYAAAVHSHLISDVTGLQAALDGKQAAGSYAAAVHSHLISDVTGLQAALDGKQAAGSYAAAVHTHGISDVTGLSTALLAKADLVNGKIPTSQLPAVAIGETFTVGSQAAMLALDAQNGDVAIRTDLSNRKFLLTGGNPTSLSGWVEIGGSGNVISVNGQTGVGVLGAADVGAAASAHSHAIGDVTGLQAALDGKQPVGSYLTGITGSMVTSALGYTPVQPNGTGATGTWGINVTGSAATASRLLAINTSNLNTGRTPGTLEYFDNLGGIGAPSGEWHSYISVRHSNDGNQYGFQFANQFGTETLLFRGWDGTNPLSWRTILHSANFNSFAPTLTGAGASGTWNINVTGNANNITQFVVNQNLGVSNSPTFASMLLLRSGAGVGLQVENTNSYAQIRLQSAGINNDAYLTFNPVGSGVAVIQVGDINRVFINQSGATTFLSTVAASAFFESSDLRQKQILKLLPSFDEIDAIEYTFLPDGTQKWGYGAQQVQTVLPFAVKEGSDGLLKVDYTTVHTYKIAMLENEISFLKQQIKDLNNV